MARPKDQGERRADLVRAAARAIVDRGVAGLTVRDVAAQAGVSPGSVSYYYKSLDELVLAAHADAVHRFYAGRREAIERVDGPLVQLAELIRRGVPESADDLLCRVLYELHVHGARSAPHATLMSSLWQQEVSLYELVLTRGAERGSFTLRSSPRRIAETVVALEDAVGLHVVGHNPAVTVARARDLVADLVERETGTRLQDSGIRSECGRILQMKQPSFTLVQLRYFAAAAEHGSMTAAARELVVSQSAVSTAIAQLEKELGVQLLLRHHARGLALTAAGRDFYAELRGFLAHSQELADSATDAGQTLVGELVVGCFETLAPFWLPTLVSRYAEAHPAVDVRALEGEHSELKRALRSGDCEVALMYGYDVGDDLVSTRVGVAPPHVVLAADHRLARRKRVRLRDLADEPMVLLDLPHTNTYFRSLFEALGIEPQVRHRTRGYETVRAMVAAGHGYAVLNQRPEHDLTYAGGRVVALPIAEDLPPLDIVVARVRDSRLTRKADAFVRVCASLRAP